MEIKEAQVFYAPATEILEMDGFHFLVDGQGPNWAATDSRGSGIFSDAARGLPFGEIVTRYAAQRQVDLVKSRLHVHHFVAEALRARLLAPEPVARPPYRGRSHYLKPERLRELWIHTNNSCNLTCTHCLVNSSPTADRGLPTAMLKDLIDQAVGCGVERFFFTGGESFARPDIFELIGHITEQKQAELIILTNATLFQGRRLEQLSCCRRDRLRLQISLDGAGPETNDRYRGEGTFKAIREGTRRAAQLGFPISLSTVVTSENVEEVPGITELVKEWGADSQHLMWMHRRGRVLETTPDSFPTPARLIDMVRTTKARAEALGVTVDNLESIKLRVNGRPFVKHDLGNQFWDSACVYSDGRVYPSAAMADFAPLAAGAIQEKSLREIWLESPVARVFREASLERREFLRGDPLRFLIGGGDVEHSYFFSVNGNGEGNLHAPDPYYEVYAAMAGDSMIDLARSGRASVRQKSGFDAPVLYHRMGEGAISCGTDTDQIDTGRETAVAILHSNCVLAFDIEKSRRVVQEFYAQAAEEPKAELCCPTSYQADEISHIPAEVLERFYGCGSPVAMAMPQAGEAVVDLGSGGGIDCFIAAKKVGSSGRVIGIDMTEAMLDVAERNKRPVAEALGFDVVEFRRGFLEEIPVDSNSVDLVVSNCVINLSPNKKQVFGEMWRLLKNHGRIVVSDIVSETPVPDHLRVNRALWGECISGALAEEEFLGALERSGFYGLQVLKKNYWKEVEGYRFYSVTVRGYKFEKSSGCVFRGQKAVYLGPQKGVVDEEGHFFPRNEAIEVCTDTAAKLLQPPYAGSFVVLEPGDGIHPEYACCAPGSDKPCC